MRVWVSKEYIKQMGYGEYPFQVHNRKREATILEVKDNKVTYTLKTNKDDYLGDTILKLPVDTFIKVYEPYQEAMNFICYINGNKKEVKYLNGELLKILNDLKPTRILG